MESDPGKARGAEREVQRLPVFYRLLRGGGGSGSRRDRSRDREGAGARCRTVAALKKPASEQRLRPLAKCVADAGGGLVFLVGDRLFELFVQGRLDPVEGPQRLVQGPQLLDHPILFELLLQA